MSFRKLSYGKQASILVIAVVFVRFIGFLYRVPLTNIIGDEGNGIYSRSYNIYTFFLILSSAGLPSAISKMISERLISKQYRNAHQIFKISLVFSGIIGLVFGICLWFGAEFISNFLHSEDSYLSMRTLAPTIFIVAIMSSFRGYYQGMRNTIPTAISQILEQIFNAIFSVYLAYIFIEISVAHGAAGGTAGTGIGALIGLISILCIYLLVRSSIQKKVRKDDNAYGYEKNASILKELIYTAFPIIFGTAIFSMTNFIDMKMVSEILISTNKYTLNQIDALYGQLTGKYVVLITLPVSIASALGTTIIPNIAGEYKLNKLNKVNKKINLALKYAMIFSVPASMGFAILGKEILLFLFPKYPEGGILIQVGALSVIFLALTQISTGILQGIGKLYIPVISASIGSLIKIPINYFLIKIEYINVIGAVVSTTVCYIVASIISMYYVCKVTKVSINYSIVFFKPILASIVMGMCSYIFYYTIYFLTKSNSISLVLSIIVSSIVYFVYMLIIKGIDEKDLKVFLRK